MILLVTNRRDITMDYVVAELRRREIPFYRLNTELLPHSISTMSGRERRKWSIRIGDHEIRGDEVTAAYFRRPGAPNALDSVKDQAEKRYVESEWGSFLKSLYMRLEDVWFSSPTQIFLAEDKPRQLILAHELGFEIPEGFVTNDWTLVKKLTNQHRSIGKPLREAVLSGDNERVMFTHRIDELSESDAEAVALAPFIVQKEILKRYDVRVTVVGTNIFATAIWSQTNAETEVDWRQGTRTDLKHERIELEESISRRCIALVRALGLKFGAIDFVRDQEGKLWFLEVNPNGQWAWIENLTGYPISKAIVDELEEISFG
ncbi:hypothetical protein KVQ82_01500 [Pseudomonas sp. AO-1]|uniref:MvdC/MvdD family ATP grasp protein n=1 Tax=Pseudomonas TaxID=286 RepID=UPI0012404DAD|nr:MULTISPECIES: hypothetical protein [Pseudomonas]QXZ14632.1 hypothetical protein KVQ82_01500 [Pseudomonas sp. AO-1]VVM76440.1 hypothetical protein PS676_02044 [Pseudomonas fluorescens]